MHIGPNEITLGGLSGLLGGIFAASAALPPIGIIGFAGLSALAIGSCADELMTNAGYNLENPTVPEAAPTN